MGAAALAKEATLETVPAKLPSAFKASAPLAPWASPMLWLPSVPPVIASST